ncbi:hypothetical protein T492DRAFT_1126713 [Pavlovales sp. CCMP2436]|nr:hypothetical protein T492DRAFT_1126713 [Pavlovales sp. CCMP2436]
MAPALFKRVILVFAAATALLARELPSDWQLVQLNDVELLCGKTVVSASRAPVWSVAIIYNLTDVEANLTACGKPVPMRCVCDKTQTADRSVCVGGPFKESATRLKRRCPPGLSCRRVRADDLSNLDEYRVVELPLGVEAAATRELDPKDKLLASCADEAELAPRAPPGLREPQAARPRAPRAWRSAPPTAFFERETLRGLGASATADPGSAAASNHLAGVIELHPRRIEGLLLGRRARESLGPVRRV